MLLKTAMVLQEVADRGKLSMRRMPARILITQLTTLFRRHETKVEVTMLKKTVRTRMRTSTGRVPQLRVYSQRETELNAYMRVQQLSSNTDPQ
jgi:hypothetical protein